MSNLSIPVGEYESFGLIKEVTYGVYPGEPSLWHGLIDFGVKSQNAAVPATGARHHYGQTFPGTGGYTVGGSLSVESTPDTLGQLLAYSMGAQTAPTQTIVSLSLSSSTIIGATAFPVGSSLPINVVPGMVITIDTAANQETLTVANPALTVSAGVYSVNTTAGATKAHSSAATVTVTGTNAYYTKMTMGKLPSFSAKLDRITDQVAYLGGYVESATLTINEKAGLDWKGNLVFKTEQSSTSASPTFSTKKILSFNNPNNYQTFFSQVIGASGQVATRSLSLTINNNLAKDYYSGSSGRTVQDFPQQQRSVKGSVELGFETNDAYKRFLGSSSATSPQYPVLGGNLSWTIVAQDVIDSGVGVPFIITLSVPNLYPTGHAVPNKATGYLTQTFEFDAAESSAAANDDLTIHYVGTNSAVF